MSNMQLYNIKTLSFLNLGQRGIISLGLAVNLVLCVMQV